MSPLPGNEVRASVGPPMYGLASSCGRRRDMEDAVSVRPEFLRQGRVGEASLHFFGVFDGHGCSHVAEACKERMHELVAEELAGLRHPIGAETEWKAVMEMSFTRMEEELVERCNGAPRSATCRCKMQAPDCHRVGSTAVVAVVTPDRVVVANCGDSRVVLCRNGVAFPLSSDHKPERPDELQRIQAAGGQVIYWDCPRVLGVLSMSRAIGKLSFFLLRARREVAIVDEYSSVTTFRRPLPEAVRHFGAGGDGDREDGGGRVSDPGERRLMGRGAQPHRLQDGEDVPAQHRAAALPRAGRSRNWRGTRWGLRQGVLWCRAASDEDRRGPSERGQRQRGGRRPPDKRLPAASFHEEEESGVTVFNHHLFPSIFVPFFSPRQFKQTFQSAAIKIPHSDGQSPSTLPRLLDHPSGSVKVNRRLALADPQRNLLRERQMASGSPVGFGLMPIKTCCLHP